MPGMTKRLGRTNRVEFRLPPDLDAEVRAECARLGWNITEWGERACRSLLSELAAVPSEAKGGAGPSRLARPPVPSTSPDPETVTGTGDGVRPAAPSQGVAQAPPRAHIEPVWKVKGSTDAIAPGALRVHTPNCKCSVCQPSATKPRPKASTRKTKP